jgi:hypothetical protein
VYFRPEELMDAAVTWNCRGDAASMELEHRTTSFAPPSPIYSANRIVPLLDATKEEWRTPLQAPLYGPPGWTPERLHAFYQRTPRGFIHVPASGAPLLYIDLNANSIPATIPAPYKEVNEALLRTLLPNLTPAEQFTRAKALTWLLERTLNRGREYLIFFDDWDSRKLANPEGTLIRPSGPKLENAGCFGLYLLEVRSK